MKVFFTGERERDGEIVKIDMVLKLQLRKMAGFCLWSVREYIPDLIKL